VPNARRLYERVTPDSASVSPVGKVDARRKRGHRLSGVVLIALLLAVTACSANSPRSTEKSSTNSQPSTATDQLSRLVVQSGDLPATGWVAAAGVLTDDRDVRLPTCLGTLATQALVQHRAAGANFAGPDGLLVQSQARTYVRRADLAIVAAALANLQKASACYSEQGKEGFTDPKHPEKNVVSELAVRPAPQGIASSLKFIGEGKIITNGPQAFQNVTITIYLGFFLQNSTEVVVSFLGTKGKLIPADLRDAVLHGVGRRMESAP